MGWYVFTTSTRSTAWGNRGSLGAAWMDVRLVSPSPAAALGQILHHVRLAGLAP